MKISIKKLVFGLMIVGVLAPFAVYAADTTYTPLAPLPCIESPQQKDPATGAIIPAIKCDKGNGSLAETVTFQTYVQYTFNLLIALAAVASVFMMVYGGFLYMTSSAVTTKEDGLKKVYNAVGGLALVLCSFLILKTINPQFVQVPASLVTPLGLSSENTTSAWMTTVQTQMDNYKITDATIKNQVSNIETTVNKDMSDTDSLATGIYSLTGEEDTAQACKDAATYNDSPDVSNLCAEWQNSQQKQAQDKSAGNLLVYQGLLNKSTGIALNSPSNYDVLSTQLKDISSNYEDSYKKLVQGDATQAQLDALTDTENSSLAKVNALLVNIQGVGAVNTAVTDIANIKDQATQKQAAQDTIKLINSTGSSISNPGAKTNFYGSLKTQIAQLNKFANPTSK